MTRENSRVDGPGVRSADVWALLDFASPLVFIDPGPSPAGNPGPYLKVPHKDGETVHRVYPEPRWLGKVEPVRMDGGGWGWIKRAER